LSDFPALSAAAVHWPELCKLLCGLRKETTWEGQLALVRRWYQPHLDRLRDHVSARAGDLDQLEQIAGTYPTRGSFLSELTLDPPEATSAEAVPPHLDEDYLVLSTIHSAKGQEWDAVFVLNVIDGCIPSDMAVGTREQVEEERRLLYVAMTRARQHLHLMYPMRLFRSYQHRHGDGHVLTLRSRFIPDSILDMFERCAQGRAVSQPIPAAGPSIQVDVAARMREMWE
jgi:DNA helicase-2/ATP-dependent DNA helicase PcrA